MGHDSLQIRVLIRKFPIKYIRLCYRSICNHPFLVGLVCFLILLYRSSPFLVSFLVAASPVLVCTAVLLGTLLSFGEPNIPEIEKEEKVVAHEIAPLIASVSQDATVVERDVSFTELRTSLIEQPSSVETEDCKIGDAFDSSVDNLLPVVDKPREIQFEKLVVDEDEKELDGLELEKKREVLAEKSPKFETEGLASDGEEIANQYTLIGQETDENLEVETDRSPGESVGYHTRQPLDSEEDDVSDEKSSDDESDGAESSSPDASLADIMPMLDELHPLLDDDIPQPAHMSQDDSDAASERSSSCHDDIIESDADSENKGEEEVDGDDEEEEEEEESAREDKDDASTSAIIWTEDDHKNVMDLGTSEIERNQRLESLIARRKARKTIISMMHQKDLIDLHGADLPFNVPPIATTRRNPFDHDDSYGDMGLPPIPGSAPSIMQPRRNPFDIPYDSSEEKPDLKEDSFQQEFAGFQQKESAFFQRHESFSWGPSTLGGHKHERQDIKWRPYFVPERLASEGTSYPSILRQLSELSDAKTSSVPDTESVCSAIDQDDVKLDEQYFSQERELMPCIDHASDQVGHESQSSEDVDSVDNEEIVQRDTYHDEVEISAGNLEIHPILEAGDAATPVETGVGEIHLKPKPVEDYSSKSSMSSLPEVSEVVSDVNKEGTTKLELEGILAEESGISKQPSSEESEFDLMSVAQDGGQQHKEPVYDSSPLPIEKLLSFTSISSEIAYSPASEETTAPLADEESKLQMGNRDIDIPSDEVICEASSHIHEVHENISRSEEVSEVSELVVKDGTTEVEKGSDSASELDRFFSSNLDAEVHLAMSQNVDEMFNSVEPSDQIPYEDLISTAPEDPLPSVVTEHVAAIHPRLLFSEAESLMVHALDKVETLHSAEGQIDSSSSLENRSQEERTNGDEYFPCEQDEFNTPSSDAEVRQDVHEKFDSVVIEQLPVVHPSSFETGRVEDHTLDQEEALQFEQKEVQSSSNDESVSADIHQDLDVKVVSQSSYEDAPSEENFSSELERQPTWLDKSMVEPSFDDHNELQEPSTVEPVFTDAEEGISENLTMAEFHEPEEQVSMSHDSTLNSSEISVYKSEVSGDVLKEEDEDHVTLGHVNSSSVQFETHIPEANINIDEDEIKEIDEGLLSELDRVGDFSIQEVESLNAEMTAEGTEVMSAELELLENELNVGETNLELPAFEARSMEDIEMAFKQLHEGVDIEEVILPSSFADGLDMGNSEETNSNFQVIDARSAEDIHVALKEISEGNLVNLPEPLVSKDGLDMGNSEETSSNFQIVDARSVEDIHVAMKEFSEGNLVNSSEPLDSKDELDMGNSDETSSNFQIVDARSVEDIHVAMKEVSEGNLVSSPEPLDSKDGLDMENSQVVEARSVEDIHVAMKEVSEGNLVNSSEPLDSKDGLDMGNSEETNSNLQASVEDIHAAMKEDSESSLVNPSEPVDSKDGLDMGNSDVSDSDIQVPYVRSIEDIHVPPMEVSGYHLVNSPEPLDSKDGVDMGNSEETNSNFQVIDARSMEDIHEAPEEFSEYHLVNSPEPLHSKDELDVENSLETNSNFQIIDARSVEDIHVAPKEVSEYHLVNSPEPLDSKDELGMENSVETNSNFQVIDARSVEDIHVAPKDVSEGNLVSSPEPLDSKDGLDMENSQVIEARPVEDIHVALKEISEGSLVNSPEPLDCKDGLDMGNSDESSSNFELIDARSVEDIHAAMKEDSEGNLVNSPEPLDSKDGSAGVEGVSSTKDLDSARVEPDVEDISTFTLDKPADGLDEASGSSNLSISNTKRLEGEVSSSSSSSSDSDSSDSD